MPNLKTYKLFISHSWSADFEYASLVDLLTNSPLFLWRNLSITETKLTPDPSSPALFSALSIKLAGQINDADCILILAGLYHHHQVWLDTQIKLAEAAGIPIIVVKAMDRGAVPKKLRSACKIVTGWNSKEITMAIRKFAL